PPESQALKTPPRKPYTVTRIALAPAVKRVALEVEGAYAEPLRPLAGRIADALARAGQGKVQLPLAALAEFSLEPDFDMHKDVSATLEKRRVLQLTRGKPRPLHGLAVDIGTTSVVVFLCNLERGDIAAVRTAGNPQAAYGEDVISRMTHVYSDVAMLSTLQKLLVDEINRMVAEAAHEAGVALTDIADAVVVGNPTMQHILLGINPAPLGRGPYLPVLSDGVEVEAASLGLAMMPRAPVFVLPMPAGYIGGDTVSAVLTRGPEFYRGNNLLVDIGTNGEVVLARDGVLTATSCATGPVYEGAHIACGVRAAPGAIERVWVEDGRNLRWAAIPGEGERDKRPVGLCGSGVISTVTALAGAGLIGSDGAFAAAGSHPRIRASAQTRQLEALLVPGMGSRTGRDIVFTQQDVRAVQLGKAALRAGIEILLREEGVTQLDHIYLAGTFGNHLEPRDIVAIGLVPPLPVERIESIGNAAGDGARMALFNRRERRRAHRLAQSMRVVELSNRADFQDMFVAATELSDAAIELDGD
ncbi:MAG: ASKHA domain-containing protein, partial [Burkholderiales bacterium]|nr:ASKHA domain-containing protein [Burkholderiales bacterium]